MHEVPVRTRFAPSPTGFLHIGGARTALYNWLYARHHGGTFILRIEDTDVSRSTESSLNAILDSLSWLEVHWDEGPLHQSKRLEIYQNYADKLLDRGLAYHSVDEEKGKAIRFKMPHRSTTVKDLIHKEVVFDTSLIDDFVIIKSDGFPAYNFACVVDDYEMGITHVIRGDEHISNTPKQLALYEALELQPPHFAHIPMILGQDGAKLSKRHGATNVMEYKSMGILPEALRNFIVLLGWSPGNDREILSLDELIELFDLDRVRKVSSQFNIEKLTWMNSQYIKTSAPEYLVSLVKEALKASGRNISRYDEKWLAQVCDVYRERMKTIPDILTDAKFFFDEEITYNETAVEKHIIRKDGVELLEKFTAALENAPDFEIATLEHILGKFREEHDVGFKKLAQAVRVAVTGDAVSPGLFETLHLLGKEKTLARIKSVIKNVSLKP